MLSDLRIGILPAKTELPNADRLPKSYFINFQIVLVIILLLLEIFKFIIILLIYMKIREEK